MSENTHSVAIGAFIVGALLIVTSTVVFLLGSGIGASKQTVVMVFDGSVKGLSVGAPVALRGVQIGQVTDINLILEAGQENLIMLVEAALDDNNIQRKGERARSGELSEDMIARGLRAQLNTQSLLTGLLYVQLDFHPDTPVQLTEVDSPHVQIPTIPTELQKLSRQIEAIDFAQVASDLRDIATGMKSVITSESFQAVPAQLQTTLGSVTDLSEELQAMLATSGPQLERLLDAAGNSADSLQRELPMLATGLRRNLELLETTLGEARQTLADTQTLVAEDSPTTYRLNEALQELTAASRALRQLARTLEQQPEALLRGKSED